ncbi:MAG: radical SAM protein [Prevotellaceae bacterium]|jgi:radical SAM protein with 4Fe4S-binding SPASM domain|nr:radical SAM protein [Prevotellaceae bacterium]
MTQEILTKKYILNPCYILRNDINRIVLTDASKEIYNHLGRNSFSTFIHPIHAMLFCFFRGDKTLGEVLTQEICPFFDLSEESGWTLVAQFIENKGMIVVEYDNHYFYMPELLLIENKNYQLRDYKVEEFNIMQNLDFESPRYNIPIDTTLMINTLCACNCIYCYADRRMKMQNIMPFERIKELIKETKELKFRTVDVTGGELFLYDQWKELLSELYLNDYNPYLSTKVPLNNEDIDALKDLGVRNIQISFDSIFYEDLKINLEVGEVYYHNMLNTIKMLDQKGITTKIKSVLTSSIFDIDKINAFVDYFQRHKNVTKLEFTAPGYSLYKTPEEFINFRLSLEQINILTAQLQKRAATHFAIHVDAQVLQRELYYDSFDNKKQNFEKRAKCTGNERSFLILPNADVTICEEAYFNKNLKLGNLLHHSIMEMWNSAQAKELFYIAQNKFPKESACSRCNEFTACRHNTGICWIDVIAAYGEENWLYPYPECPYAPPLINKIYYE